MDHTVAEEYKSSLNDLNFNSKPLINMLTMLADENKKHASLIVNTIVNHINSASLESKLPGLYLIDSIVKNLGDQYLKIFCQHIIRLFTSVFEKVDENTRSLMFKLRQTWREILPNKVLYNLDVSVQKLDPAWPVTAKNPSKTILINPKFLEGSVEEKKSTDVPTTILKKEEDKIKQRQGEVLKQLLAKQEQLRQLEFKKLQLSMKKKSAAIGSNSTSSKSFKQNPIRDPRMVKINNVPQNISAKTGINPASQGKPMYNHDSISPVHGAGKTAVHTKAQAQSCSNNSKSRVTENENSTDQSISKDSVQPSLPDKRAGSKNKRDKWALNKVKYNCSSKDKINQEVKCSSNENVGNPLKTEESSLKNEVNLSKPNEKNSREAARISKVTPKKRSMVSDKTRKFSQMNSIVPIEVARKKIPLLKIPKKSDKMKSINSDALNCLGNKVNINAELNSCAANEMEKKKKDTILKLNEASDKAKSVVDEIMDSPVVKPTECVIDSTENNIKCISQKDEDLRINSVPLNEEAAIRVPKREVAVPDLAVGETDNTLPPRKKIKSEVIENSNSDYRSDSPVLFGSEDQDLRQSKTSVTDINSKDWTQYKATHPNEYSPSPNKLDNSDGRLRSRKHQFSEFKYYQSEHDRYDTSRYLRGRYVSRRVRRPHFPRGVRGRPFYISPVRSVMLDSQAFLQQAEEKYQSGKISETEYVDLRRDLQKMVESTEYQSLKNHLSKLQNTGHHERNQDSQKLRKDYDNEIFRAENLKIQGPSVVLPVVKPFVLDGKEKFIHFVDDRALVLMDNNEPRELTFKDENKKVYVEGLAEPLTLGFDGKSVEFEVDGRRHIMRFGTPGRELYINNHPYEAQFGGPPIAAMLEDGCVYKLLLSGPPPQVIIGSKPQYELFSKYHGNVEKPAFKPESDHPKEDLKLQSQYTTPSCAFLQDVDMRVKPENMTQPDVLMSNSPFYVKDMKDVDWRQIPPSNLDADKNIPPVFNETAPKNFETWPEEDNRNRIAFSEERNNQSHNSLPNEPPCFEWEASEPHHQPLVQVKKSDLAPSTSQEKWYNQEDKSHWRNNEYNQSNQPAHPQERPPYQGSSSIKQHFGDQIEHYNPRNNSYMPYLQRPSFQNRRMRGRGCGPTYGPWVSNVDRGPRHGKPQFTQSQTNFSAGPSKALLPSPPFPPEYPSTSHTSLLPTPVDPPMTSIEAQVSTSGFTSLPDSELIVPESSSTDQKVDVESLLEKLVAAGIINAKPYEQPVSVPVTSEDTVPETSIDDGEKESPTPSEEVPEIELSAESLRVHHTGVISALHKGLQCATCGMRFKEMQSDHYSRHLDWHFRMNRREKDGAKKAISRRWYYEVEDWVQFEEFEDFEERIPSYFELQADNQQPEVPEVPTVISVPATSDDEEACPVCSERFQLFWVEDEEEWHYRDAVRHDNVTYHPACYEDFKKASAAEKAARSLESNACELHEVNEDVTDFLNSLLDNVCKNIEKETEVPSEIDFNTSEIVEEVPSEVQFEEILEGKPGEEEIIGVISESDMEVENDIPKTESKMVVMQSGGITLKVKAESLQCHSPSNPSEKDTKPGEDKVVDDEEIDFRPPTPDPNFEVRPPVSRGRELSGLCCIM